MAVKKFYLLLLAAALFGCSQMARGQTSQQVNLAVLDFGDSPFGRIAADKLLASLKSVSGINIVDRDLSRLAVHGVGYTGSLNLSLKEARDLGEAIGCDFYLTGDAQTLRRSRSSNPVYFESYASIFLVSSRTGRLVMWERPSFQTQEASLAEQKLIEELGSGDFSRRYVAAIQKAQKEERQKRELAIEDATPVIVEAPEDEKAAEAEGLRLPKPYRRLRPVYPDTAARADAEAAVDVLVDLNASGEISRVDVERWAGFGLDEATVDTVRQLHFFPAMRNGAPVPIRVLLRYNFRKPAR